MNFNSKYSDKQKEWCKEYERITTVEPVMGDFEAGHVSFEDAANNAVGWFESWGSDSFLQIGDVTIPS